LSRRTVARIACARKRGLAQPIERAFNLAHAAANPNAMLFLNEQAIKRWGSEKNRVAFLNLVDSLIGKGVPIHGIGFESHIVKWTGGVSHECVMWLLGELQKRNLEVQISEFDVSVFGGSNGARWITASLIRR
jgi:endo-1,4-beta-xylanase